MNNEVLTLDQYLAYMVALHRKGGARAFIYRGVYWRFKNGKVKASVDGEKWRDPTPKEQLIIDPFLKRLKKPLYNERDETHRDRNTKQGLVSVHQF